MCQRIAMTYGTSHGLPRGYHGPSNEMTLRSSHGMSNGWSIGRPAHGTEYYPYGASHGTSRGSSQGYVVSYGIIHGMARYLWVDPYAVGVQQIVPWDTAWDGYLPME